MSNYELSNTVTISTASGKASIRGEYKYPFNVMDVGQSFFVPESDTAKISLRRSVTWAQSRFGRKFLTRSTIEDGATGIRIWRIE
jgi:hypothetical protein